jgi:hypothetical protein
VDISHAVAEAILSMRSDAIIAADHEYSLRSRDFIISWLDPTPHAQAVYASCAALPPPHATLASRRPATALRNTMGIERVSWRRATTEGVA